MGSPTGYTVVVDALQVLCTGKIPDLYDVSNASIKDNYVLSGELMLRKNNNLTHPGFLYCFNVLWHNNKFCHFFYGNSGKYRYAHKDICHIVLENHFLYQDGWQTTFRSMLAKLKLEFYKYHYMEIAVDGYDLIDHHSEYTYNERLTRKRPVRIYPTYDAKLRRNTHYRLGSSKSEKVISIYDKTLELLSSNKDYIAQFWQRSGMYETNRNVNRCELRLRDKALKEFSHDMDDLINHSYLASYFQLKAGHFLEFYQNDSPQRRFCLIDWTQFDYVAIKKVEMTRKARSTGRYKSMLRYLFEEYAITGDEQYLRPLADITARYNMMNWLHRTVPRWIKEFRN